MGPYRHPTGVTIVLFLVACGVLGVAPLPAWLKPIDLQGQEQWASAASRVLKKPRMTLASLEQEPSREPAVDMPVEPAEDEAPKPPEPAVVVVEQTKPGAPFVRKKGPRSPEDERTWKLARSLDARGADVENPCVLKDTDGCAKTALDPFFTALDALAQRDAPGNARAVVLGNSLIASDHVTDVVRSRLVRRFGDGGKGFVLPDRLSKTAGRRVRTGNATDGWLIHTFAQDHPARTAFGFTGSMHESSRSGEKTWWRADGAERARLFLLDHKGAPGFTLFADGAPILQRPASTAQRDEDIVVDVDVPAGTKKVELDAAGAGLVVYGATFERKDPGVVVDTIGVPAASVAYYLTADEGVLQRQLKEIDPTLVVVMLGGNEIRSFSYGTLKPAQLVEKYRALLDRLKDAAPGAACLAIAPIDAVKATAGGEELVTRGEVQEVVKIERQVALEKGCAFFDLYGAMGGRGALARFKAAGLLSEDLVHPTGRGGDVLGALIAEALLDAWETTALPKDPAALAKRPKAPRLAGLMFPAAGARASSVETGALARFFDRLRSMEQGAVPHVKVGVLGASDIAAEAWPGRVRARLAERFGFGGRGLVAVRHDDARIGSSGSSASAGVLRSLVGPHDVVDGRAADFGAAVGVSGTRARLMPGARFDVRFPPAALPSPGAVDVVFLRTPDMGTADVFVDGARAATIAPALTPASDIDVVRVALPSPSSRVAIVVRGGADAKRPGAAEDAGDAVGPVHLLDVAAELDGRGVVVDGIGLAGATGMTPQRFRQDVWRDAAAARRWDLVVATFGGDEAMLASLDEASYRHHYEATVKTLLAGSPGAACVVVGPPDRAVLIGDHYAPPPAQELVDRVTKDVAQSLGCAFFSSTKAMGGQGSVERWVEEGLVAKDRVRFTDAGYQKLGDLLVEDLLAAYAYDSAAKAAEVASGAAAKGPQKADASSSSPADAVLAAAAGGSG